MKCRQRRLIWRFCNYFSDDKDLLAERGGFEPPVQLLTVQRFSKPPPSATRPPLRCLLTVDYHDISRDAAAPPDSLRRTGDLDGVNTALQTALFQSFCETICRFRAPMECEPGPSW